MVGIWSESTAQQAANDNSHWEHHHCCVNMHPLPPRSVWCYLLTACFWYVRERKTAFIDVNNMRCLEVPAINLWPDRSTTGLWHLGYVPFRTCCGHVVQNVVFGSLGLSSYVQHHGPKINHRVKNAKAQFEFPLLESFLESKFSVNWSRATYLLRLESQVAACRRQ